MARRYLEADSAGEAVRLRRENPGSRYLAGGTVLNSAAPEGTLIYIGEAGMNSMSETRVGSTATFQEIADSSAAHPALRKSAFDLANRNIRNMATLGGNVAANKPGSDMIGTLIVMDARLEIMPEDGQGLFETDISEWIGSPAGLIVSVLIGDPEKEVFIKRFSRTKNDIPLMKFTAGFRAGKDRLDGLRIALSSMAGRVIELEKTAELVSGRPFGELDRDAIADAAQSEVSPLDDHRASGRYRRDLLAAAIDEFLEEICS